MARDKEPNRLATEKSPYLLQHAENPVDWFPWGEQAFAEARRLDRPVFLSVGYATCHWCHVMAHESFEDEEVAAMLNENFVAVKVDREERPDIDNVYMTVCQALTGRGGWPLSVFLTPDARPFFAGTYFPKRSRMGMPGFMDLLDQISGMWRDDRQRISRASRDITEALKPRPAGMPRQQVGMEELAKGYAQLASAYDETHGGFGTAPKFPTPHNLTFLLRWHRATGETRALDMVIHTLNAMRNGGIFDHLGLGISRYSVDEKWLVPHFEKMLYDQALVANAAVEAFQATGDPRMGRIAEDIFTYVLRDMTSPEGGFYSAEDADSEGEEGRFYVWTPDQVREVLGENLGNLFCDYYGVTEKGNFEHGASIPHVTRTVEQFAEKRDADPETVRADLRKARERLFHAREKRIHPLKDDKVLCGWNGLMIAALAKGSMALGNTEYLEAAQKAEEFVAERLRDENGRLLRRWREGEAAHPGFLEDYAYLAWGLLELHQASFLPAYLETALKLVRDAIDLFWDTEGGGFYFTGKGNEELITKSKDLYDGALPSGNSVSFANLVRLSRLTGDVTLEEKADRMITTFSGPVATHPMGYTHFLGALYVARGPGREIVLTGNAGAAKPWVDAVHRRFVPESVVAFRQSGPLGERMASLAPFMADMGGNREDPAAFVCQQHACQAPVEDLGEFEKLLDAPPRQA
ncbi:MAG: thioredoxin domain-containing protein [Desulfatibacillaceae bacterium]